MFELILLSVIGLFFLIVGILIWKRQKIGLVHEYHHMNITEYNKKAYTKQVGKGCVLIGIGSLIAGIIDFITNTPYGFIVFGLLFIWGIATILLAQKKYNGGLF